MALDEAQVGSDAFDVGQQEFHLQPFGTAGVGDDLGLIAIGPYGHVDEFLAHVTGW